MRQLIIQSAVSGLLVGGIYGMVALGLALSFGVLKVLNVAHGELVMLGGYAAFFLFSEAGVDPLLSIPVVFILLFAFGMLLYSLLFKFVVRFDIETRIKNSLLISFGLVLILQAVAVFFFSGDDRTIVTGYSSKAFVVTGWIRIPWARSAGLVVAVIAAFLLEWLLNRTTFGHAVRGTSEDWALASLTGIDVRRVYMIAFAISAALAGLAGSLVSLGYSISPSIGLGWTLKALIVIVLAGLGSMRGIVAAGALLGLIEGLSSVWLGSAYRGVVALVVFLVVLSFRPQGLFGREGTHV
jgi:branched-chain amino acid transport system permease protein